MDERFCLDDVLASIINITESNGDRHIYLNPPPDIRMCYPAIKYSLNKIDLKFANNGVYQTKPSYEVTLIDENIDTKYLADILRIPYCRFDRFYIADNLNHWVFTIYI